MPRDIADFYDADDCEEIDENYKIVWSWKFSKVQIHEEVLNFKIQNDDDEFSPLQLKTCILNLSLDKVTLNSWMSWDLLKAVKALISTAALIFLSELKLCWNRLWANNVNIKSQVYYKA